MDEVDDGQDQRIAGVAALDQPLRRRLYRLLVEDEWTGRDAAAEALDVPRSVAAFHLDKLAEAGVVEVNFQRPDGRSGPGAGRPAKLYRRASPEVAASVPDRHYELAGSLLAAALADAERSGASPAERLAVVAREEGRRRGQSEKHDLGPRDRSLGALERNGYEPVVGGDAGAPPTDEIVLANCPFHRLAHEQRDLVCGMNLDFLGGVIEGAGAAGELEAHLAPETGRCCVRIRPAEAAS